MSEQIPSLRRLNSALCVPIYLLSLLCWLNAHDADAATINIDFESSGPPAPRQGDDGILSLPGQILWNRVFPVNAFNPTENLVDASGTSTNVSFRTIDELGVTSYSPPDVSDANDLQDKGFGVSSTTGFVLFELRNLIPQEVYDLAIYLSESLTRNTATRLDVEHQAGIVTGLQTSSPTFSLPGMVNQDYLLFNDLQPLDLGDGAWGFLHTITYEGPTGVPVAGIVSGLQLSGSFLNPDLPGDHNDDGAVDAADYIAWRKTDGLPSGYDAWRTHFGEPGGGGSSIEMKAGVPEPDSASLFLLVGILLAMRLGR